MLEKIWVICVGSSLARISSHYIRPFSSAERAIERPISERVLLTFNVHSSSYEFYLASAAAWGVHTYTRFYFSFFVALRGRYTKMASLQMGARCGGEKKTPRLCTTHSPPFTCNSFFCLPVLKLVLGCSACWHDVYLYRLKSSIL